MITSCVLQRYPTRHTLIYSLQSPCKCVSLQRLKLPKAAIAEPLKTSALESLHTHGHIPLHTSPTGLLEGSDVSGLNQVLALCEIFFHCKDVLEVSSVLLLRHHLHTTYHPALILYQDFAISLNKCSYVRFRIDIGVSRQHRQDTSNQNYKEKLL